MQLADGENANDFGEGAMDWEEKPITEVIIEAVAEEEPRKSSK